MSGTPARSPRSVVSRKLVWARAGGSCERCGRTIALTHRDYSFHHRRPRGMGGSRTAGTHLPSNLLLLCGSGTTGCHGEVESKRVESFFEGWLVHQGDDPGAEPVLLHDGRRVLLSPSGSYTDLPEGESA